MKAKKMEAQSQSFSLSNRRVAANEQLDEQSDEQLAGSHVIFVDPVTFFEIPFKRRVR